MLRVDGVSVSGPPSPLAHAQLSLEIGMDEFEGDIDVDDDGNDYENWNLKDGQKLAPPAKQATQQPPTKEQPVFEGFGEDDGFVEKSGAFDRGASGNTWTRDAFRL